MIFSFVIDSIFSDHRHIAIKNRNKNYTVQRETAAFQLRC